jgi:hypothetical protein
MKRLVGWLVDDDDDKCRQIQFEHLHPPLAEILGDITLEATRYKDENPFFSHIRNGKERNQLSINFCSVLSDEFEYDFVACEKRHEIFETSNF